MASSSSELRAVMAARNDDCSGGIVVNCRSVALACAHRLDHRPPDLWRRQPNTRGCRAKKKKGNVQPTAEPVPPSVVVCFRRDNATL